MCLDISCEANRSLPTDPIICFSLKKDGAVVLFFTTWQHSHGKLCFEKDIRLSAVTPVNNALQLVKHSVLSRRKKATICDVSHKLSLSRKRHLDPREKEKGGRQRDRERAHTSTITMELRESPEDMHGSKRPHTHAR